MSSFFLRLLNVNQVLWKFKNQNFAGIKVTDGWKEREIRLKMHLIEKKSCFLQQFRKIATMAKNEIKIAISTFFGQLGKEGMGKTSQLFG